MSTAQFISMTRAAADSNRLAKMASFIVLAAGTVFLAISCNPAQASLFLVGGALGLTLYHASFGFTSAWRVFISEGRGQGLRAQMALLALGVLLFFPVLNSGTLFGKEITGAVSPLGLSVLIGAFMFGIGMQFSGSCASGTLFTVGGGNARMLVTLAFFITGSVLATINFEWWVSLPSLPPVSLVSMFGPFIGILISLGTFAAITILTVIIEKCHHGALETQPVISANKKPFRFFKGSWPILWGAAALAVLNFITLAIAGRPWGVASAFALWGAKLAKAIGFEPSQWGTYWQSAGNAKALAASIFADKTSVMNFGIIAGAMFAAALAGRFAPNLHISFRSLAAAIAGGLLMGYGARIAYGCNIGAYFSGISSGSLHGWAWIAAAFSGNMLGVRLYPLFFAEQQATPQLAACQTQPAPVILE